MAELYTTVVAYARAIYLGVGNSAYSSRTREHHHHLRTNTESLPLRLDKKKWHHVNKLVLSLTPSNQMSANQEG